MIAIILAGGYAVRLQPITKNTAKPLLPIAGKPVIDHIMEKLQDLKEVRRVIIATNERFENQFREWLSQKTYQNVEVKVENNSKEEDKPGALGALAELIKEVESEDYLIIAGDNIFSSNLKSFIKKYREKKAPIMAVYDIKDPEKAKNFSVVKMNPEDRIISFEEKPEKPKTRLIGTCIYIFPKNSLKRIHEYLEDKNNPDSPGHFIEWLHKKDRVYGHILQGYWFDVGTPDSLKEAKMFFFNILLLNNIKQLILADPLF